MYSRILVPLDGSRLAEQILPYARLLGDRFGSRLELLQVVSEGSGGLQREAEDYLRRVAVGLETGGAVVSTKTLVGDAATVIINESHSDTPTLVAMSTCGHSGLDVGKLGGVVEGVLAGTSSPLMIIRSQPEECAETVVRLETAIVPLDGSPLAEQMLDHVASLARVLGLSVLLVRATPSTGSEEQLLEEYPEGESAGRVLVRLDISVEKYLEKVEGKLRGQGIQEIETRVLHGDPAVAIVEFAQHVPNNLVAMTTHGRSGIGPWPLGSVTELVERHCCTPVLVIRPTNGAPAS